jgi:hypothetical protein
MKYGIVIGACPGDPGWLDDLFATIQTSYPVMVHHTWAFELASIAKGAEEFNEFVFLPHSTEVVDNALWDMVFKNFEGISVSLSQSPVPFGYYLGKYLSKVVKEIGCPVIHNKAEAIGNESQWTAKYLEAAGAYVGLGDLPHTDVFVEKHGRNNMVCESKWLRRYKSCWDGPSQNAEIARLARIRRTP